MNSLNPVTKFLEKVISQDYRILDQKLGNWLCVALLKYGAFLMKVAYSCTGNTLIIC